MDAPDGIPSSPLPFGVENHSLNRWRTHSQSRHSHKDQPQAQSRSQAPKPNKPSSPQYFEDFIAAEISRDKQRGNATSPIAPSSISGVSAVQKRWLRRHRKVWWVYLVVFQLAFGSTVASVVFVVQDAKGFGVRAGHLIWLLISFAVAIGSTALLLVLSMRRRDRMKKEKGWAKLEIEKYKRDMQKSQKEADRASMIGDRLRRSYRSASLAASLRSRSRHSGHGSEDVEVRETGEAGKTFLNYQEMYGAGSNAYGRRQSDRSQPLQPRRDLAPHDHSETLRVDLASPQPPVPPKEIISSQGTAFNAESAILRKTKSGRHMSDEINPRITNSEAERFGTNRAGHGDEGSSQSDENFHKMNQLDSDAETDDSHVAEVRRGRSRERVEPWRRRQAIQQKFEDPHKPAEAPKTNRADDRRGNSFVKGIKKGLQGKIERRKERSYSALETEQHPTSDDGQNKSQRPLDVTHRRAVSLQERSWRSSSAPAHSGVKIQARGST